jgi:hypothetical protein
MRYVAQHGQPRTFSHFVCTGTEWLQRRRHATPEGLANTRTGTGFARASCTTSAFFGLQQSPSSVMTGSHRVLHASPRRSPGEGDYWVVVAGVRSQACKGKVNWSNFTACA